MERKGRVYDTEEHGHLMAKNPSFAPHRESLEVYVCERLHILRVAESLFVMRYSETSPGTASIRYTFAHHIAPQEHYRHDV